MISSAASMQDREQWVANDAADAAALVAETMARAIMDGVSRNGHANVALSGGNTPLQAYRQLATLALPWSKISIFFVDERAVAVDSPRANYASIVAAMPVLGVQVPSAQVHRMEADDAQREAAARRYEARLRAQFGVARAVAFDVVTLGIGEDGHTASLFPNKGATQIDDRLVASVDAADGLEQRMTLTAPVLREAAHVVVLALGASKHKAVVAAQVEGSVEEVPIRVLRTARGRVTWVLDKASAGGDGGDRA